MSACTEVLPPWWTWHPPVGVFIALLAVIGVLVPWFRGETSPREKAFWTFLMFAFVGMEIRTIYLDSAQHDREQAFARCQQLQSFSDIGNGIKAAINQSQQQFQETMSRSNRILTAERDSLNTFTGGNSFCYIVLFANVNVFIVAQQGKYPVYDVKARIVDLVATQNLTMQEHLTLALSGANTIMIGNLAPGSSQPINLPFPLTDKGDYNIFFNSTRNGFWTENLKIRKVNGVWMSAFRVLKDSGKRQIQLMKPTIPKDFPSGQVDWNK